MDSLPVPCFPSSQATQNFLVANTTTSFDSYSFSDFDFVDFLAEGAEDGNQEGSPAGAALVPIHKTKRVQEASASLFNQDYHDCVSRFLYHVPGILSWSERQDDSHLDVFWTSETTTQTLSISSITTEATKEMIKTTLQLFHQSGYHTLLLQFWAPVDVENQIFLSTSNLPFGLQYAFNFHKQKCLDYRKLCMQHKYCVVADGNDKNINQHHHFGPPARVYSSGLPEMNRHIIDYSIQEFPLRDLALQLGADMYLGLPVFESLGQCCVGVLEVVTFSWPVHNYYLRPLLERLYEALKEVGLTSPDIPLVTNWYRAEHEIREGLKMVCEAHNIPFAQTWTATYRMNNGETALEADYGGYYQVSGEYSDFRNTCTRNGYSRRTGVGKAFSSLASTFCKDVSQLHNYDCHLAYQAQKANLTSCFAICLRSCHPVFYTCTLELFLPVCDQTAQKEPWTFLDSVIHTMKQHFPSFKVACGIELGKELFVEVVRLSEDEAEFDRFKICQTNKPPPSQELGMQLHPSLHQQLAQVFPIDTSTTTHQISLIPGGLSQLAQVFPIDASTTTTHQIPPIPGGLISQLAQVFPIDTSTTTHQIPPIPCRLSQLAQVFPIDTSTTSHQISPIPGGLSQRGCVGEETMFDTGSREMITLVVLQKHFGKKLGQAAKDLGVSRSTFKRICRKYKISRWPSYTREMIKHSNAGMQIAQDSDCCTHTPNQGINTTINVQTQTPIKIKVKFGGDMIMFELSTSSTMTDLMHEIMERLKLEADTFKVKFLDEENDWILLACDKDLHNCIRNMKSLGRAIVRMVVEPIII